MVQLPILRAYVDRTNKNDVKSLRGKSRPGSPLLAAFRFRAPLTLPWFAVYTHGCRDVLKADLPDPCKIIPVCPICISAPLTLSQRIKGVDICVCEACGTTLSVPHEAWLIRQAHKT